MLISLSCLAILTQKIAFVNVNMAQEQLYSITLLDKKMLNADVAQLRFTKPEGFNFLAGQFVQFKVPDGEKFALRSYSISSDPTKHYLEFLVKLIPGGKASTMFKNLNKGAKALIGQARGIFVIKSPYSVKKIFVATGTGLAPMVGMIDSLSPQENIKLLFGVRSEQDLFWQERLNNIGAQSNFEVKITLSQPSESWQGLKGRVTAHLTIDAEAEYYLCGNLEMVKDARAILLGKQIKQDKIHFEIF